MDKPQDSPKKSKNLHKPPLVLSLFRFIFSYPGRLLPHLLGRWAYHLWFQTHRSVTPAREQNWLKTAGKIEAVKIKSQQTDLNGLPVMTYYWENAGQKNAPLVMLIHGWTGRGSQMGAFAAPLLKAGFRVLAFDGHAHDKTPGKASSIFKLSEVQQALAQEYGEIYAVVAHSFGGMVTAYSLNRSLKTQKVVCISPPSQFGFILSRFSHTLHLPQSIQRYMITRFKHDFGDDLEQQISATTTSRCLGHIPALIIHDENDIDVPISEAEALHQAWPNSAFIRTRGLGHRRILYDKQVIENTVNFLKE